MVQKERYTQIMDSKIMLITEAFEARDHGTLAQALLKKAMYDSSILTPIFIGKYSKVNGDALAPKRSAIGHWKKQGKLVKAV